MNVASARATGTVVVLFTLSALAQAQTQTQTNIRTDASWERTPTTLSPVQRGLPFLNGNRGQHVVARNLYVIGEAAGKVSGTNLLHSFEALNVGSGDGLLFTTSTTSLNTVVARVSGNAATTIDGLLLLRPAQGSRPDFFLINPQGVTFGPGARVDMPGALHVSTANRLRFDDGSVLLAGAGADSTLAMGAPSAFGFVASTLSAPIVMRDAAGSVSDAAGSVGPVRGGTYLFGAGGLGLSGREVELGRIRLEGPAIRIAAVGGEAIDMPLSSYAQETSLAGPIQFLGTRFLLTNAGSILLNGGRISGSEGFLKGPHISLRGRGDITLNRTVLQAAGLSPRTPSARSGSIVIDAGTNVMLSDSSLTLNAWDTAGVRIHAGSDLVLSGTAITAQSTADRTPAAGTALQLIATGTLRIEGGCLPAGALCSVGTVAGHDALGGAVLLDAHDIELRGVKVQSLAGQGRGGDIRVRAQTLRLEDRAIIIAATNFHSTSAGSILVEADAVHLGGEGILNFAGAQSSGRNGNVTVKAAHLNIDGAGILIANDATVTRPESIPRTLLSVEAPDLVMTPGSVIGARFTGNVAAAQVLINGIAPVVQTSTRIRLDASWGRITRDLDASETSGGTLHTITGNDGRTHAVQGNVYRIAQDDGRLMGRNLFHSFEQFDLDAADAALFTTTSSVDNVISRVSGVAPSRIDGLIALISANGNTGLPRFYFLNPAGLLFGTTSRFDVPGSLHLSTADGVRFADRSVFKAGTGGDAFGTTAAPASLLFDARQVASTLRFAPRSTAVLNTSTVELNYAPRSRTPLVDLLAGAIELDSIRLNVAQASLRIAAVGGGAAEIPVALGTPNPSLLGDIALHNTRISGVNVRSLNVEGGSIRMDMSLISHEEGTFNPLRIISHGDLTMENSLIRSSGFAPAGTSAAVVAEVAGRLSLMDSELYADAQASRSKGLAISANHILLGDDSHSGHFTSLSYGTGTVGGIDITVTGALQIDNGRIDSTADSGRAGPIQIRADELIVGGLRPSTIVSTGRSQAHAGVIRIIETGRVHVRSGEISTSTQGNTDTGSVIIQARELQLGSEDTFGGIGSLPEDHSSAARTSGAIDLTITGRLTLRRGSIFTDANGLSPGGSIRIAAGELIVGLGGEIRSETDGVSSAGAIAVRADTLRMESGGRISANTHGAGTGGSITLEGRLISVAGPGSGVFSEATEFSMGRVGNIHIEASETLEVRDQGSISIHNRAMVESPSGSTQGTVTVRTARLSLSQFGSLTAESSGNLAPSRIVLEGTSQGTGDLAILGDANGIISISTSALNSPDGGATAGVGSIDIRGHDIVVDAVSILSETTGETLRSAGRIDLSASGALVVKGGALISTSTSGAGHAGSMSLQGGDITLDNAAVISDSQNGATGDAGNVALVATGRIAILDAGVSSSTDSSGGAGSVHLDAKQIIVRGLSSVVRTQATLVSTGHAGTLTVMASDELVLADQGALVATTDVLVQEPHSMARSKVHITTPKITLDHGVIEAATTGNVDAGEVLIRAQSDGRGSLLLAGPGGIISTTTLGDGTAGAIRIEADNIRIEAIGLDSTVQAGHGHGGAIEIMAANELTLYRSLLATDTSGSGRAGDVRIVANSLRMEESEISSIAHPESRGQTGNLDMNVTRDFVMSGGSRLSISNDSPADPTGITPSVLSVHAATFTVLNSRITAESSGRIAASNIHVRFGDRFFLDPSYILTSANAANGGDITIEGNGLLHLDHSQISTSVLGSAGDGGDIRIRADTLLLSTGFIQANTAAAAASGGRVTLDIQSLVATGTLVLGGQSVNVFAPALDGLNVIQAAAPSGVSGIVTNTAPSVDVAGDLRLLDAGQLLPVYLQRDPCRAGSTSSFAALGPGGFRPVDSGMMVAQAGHERFLAGVDHSVPPAQETALALLQSSECR